ncbi:acyltransferase domain-containing protein [Amycolatopsis aidingensis]|uniref:acyltransferase domain-containing protein n=1 Tax=Amycolatopsis aidingensis TaxID=2842453 RepID=UPI001E4D9F3E|nr:acyltransferase domain-containing protein [Amycolatopsis aidingensis]
MTQTSGPALPVALLFPGQGAQHPRMAAGLYGHSAVFTELMDTAFELLGPEGNRLRTEWLSAEPSGSFDDVTRAQPLLYAVNCALGSLVLSWGVRPCALLGHSVGEMAAATLAGVFDFTDGIRLMRDRVDTMADTPPGGMLAVAASAADLDPFLGGQVALAAVNAPRQTMLAGPEGELAEVERSLRAKDITCRRVKAKQGFHSPMVAAAAGRSEPHWRATALRAPRIPVYSAYRPGPLRAEQATDPLFWTTQPADPVLFGPALDLLLEDRDALLLEAGPGQGLSALTRRHPKVTAGHSSAAALLPARLRDPSGQADRESVRKAVRRLGEEGHQILPRDTGLRG